MLRFINLPDRVRIEIVRAYWGGSSIGLYGTVGEVVRVFEKESPTRSFDWDLRDDEGRLVPSGFYRVFFTVDEAAVGFESATVFGDLYGVQREVSATVISTPDSTFMLGDGSWRDPTGCL